MADSDERSDPKHACRRGLLLPSQENTLVRQESLMRRTPQIRRRGLSLWIIAAVIAEASPLVPFDVYAPEGLGDPGHIYVASFPDASPGSVNDSVVAFIYRLNGEGHCTKGCVVVEEHYPDGHPTMSQEAYDAANQEHV